MNVQYSLPSRSKNSTRSRLIVGMVRPEGEGSGEERECGFGDGAETRA